MIHDTIMACYPEIYTQKIVDFFIEYHSEEEILRRANGGIVLVASQENRIVGTGFLHAQELGGIYVLPDYQHRGIGRELVTALVQFAKEKNVKRLWLDSTPIAKPLYDKLGFNLICPATQMVDGDPLNFYKMEKLL